MAVVIDTKEKYHKLLDWFFGGDPPTIIYLTCTITNIQPVNKYYEEYIVTLLGVFYLPSGKVLTLTQALPTTSDKIAKYSIDNIDELIYDL